MTKEELLTRLMSTASVNDFIRTLRDGLDEVDATDKEGNPIPRDQLVAKMELESSHPDLPSIRITATLEETKIQSQGHTIKIPTEALCEVLALFGDFHQTFHAGLQGIVTQALYSLQNDNEKLLSETIFNGFFHEN